MTPAGRGLLARRSCALFVGALVVGIFVSGFGGREAPTAASRGPNIILVTVDDADLEAYEDVGRLFEMTGGEGVHFENSFASYPLCCPSRATWMTGMYAHNHRVLASRYDAEFPGGYRKFAEESHDEDNLATWLEKRGYRTGMVGKYLNGYEDGAPPGGVPEGWDRLGRG